MSAKIRVSILDDHQSIIDGYIFRLGQNSEIEVVATAMFGEELELLLDQNPTDVLILDVFVPISKKNLNSYPILYLIPKLLEAHSELKILIITMHATPTMIKAVMEAGSSGYILKDDSSTLQELASIIQIVAAGGIHLSYYAFQKLSQKIPQGIPLTTRQLEVLSLCAAYPDATTRNLAEILGVANSTVRNLLSETYFRLDVRTRISAIAKARQMGLIAPVVQSSEF